MNINSREKKKTGGKNYDKFSQFIEFHKTNFICKNLSKTLDLHTMTICVCVQISMHYFAYILQSYLYLFDRNIWLLLCVSLACRVYDVDEKHITNRNCNDGGSYQGHTMHFPSLFISSIFYLNLLFLFVSASIYQKIECIFYQLQCNFVCLF